jgi:hypothetical protein
VWPRGGLSPITFNARCTQHNTHKREQEQQPQLKGRRRLVGQEDSWPLWIDSGLRAAQDSGSQECVGEEGCLGIR